MGTTAHRGSGMTAGTSNANRASAARIDDGLNWVDVNLDVKLDVNLKDSGDAVPINGQRERA